MRRYALLSLAAHLLVAGWFALGLIVLPRKLPVAPIEPATIEMLLKAPGEGDAPRETGAGQQAAPESPPPTAPPPTPPAPKPPPQTADRAAVPLPAPAPPAAPAGQPPGPSTPETAPAPPAARPAEPAPAIRLGMGGMPGITNDISGDIPASPDPSAPNLPPRYPSDAAEQGEHGAVLLSVVITPDGRAGSVTIASSSGYFALDIAAKEAVSRWRFRPQRDEEGRPIASRMPIRINFVLN